MDTFGVPIYDRALGLEVIKKLGLDPAKVSIHWEYNPATRNGVPYERIVLTQIHEMSPEDFRECARKAREASLTVGTSGDLP